MEESDKLTKKIIIQDTHKKNTIKKVNCEKERKLRVETKTWGLNNDELSHSSQLISLQNILLNDDNSIVENKDKYVLKLLSHIKTKLCSYKQQDILKRKLNEAQFVSLKEVIELLKNQNMRCCYCSEEVYILYEHVREMKQWSLDRVNNDIGHNRGNLVIACLACNLKRRRTNKDAFMFTKKMVIIKDEHNNGHL